ncbi:MAG: aminotransferase class IV [Cyclobacteriaceae bacterium]|jgi:4-amino-4-deoxychorismate lyase|nr:aminotransferase class IV [Cyclobacteriaceae bacterium]
MSRFIESICCIDGKIQNLALHQSRVDGTFKHFYSQSPIQLGEIIKNVPIIGKHKCRIVYDASNVEIEFQSYPKRHINTLKVVEGSHIDYDFKYEDRTELRSLFEQREDCDDILIVKNGLFNDSYFANLALFDGKKWFTPKSPLLKGVRRQALLNEERISEHDISVDDINLYSKVSLINAMLDLGEVIVSIDYVTR